MELNNEFDIKAVAEKLTSRCNKKFIAKMKKVLFTCVLAAIAVITCSAQRSNQARASKYPTTSWPTSTCYTATKFPQTSWPVSTDPSWPTEPVAS